ncbi:MAG TPA: DUF2461 domain-containing protein [Flavitalea sp.]|nr:DUF2461 domain-containing protein [Flavitalea sp.]
MLQQTTLQFLKNLKKNNKKEWFEANRTRYESAKNDVEEISAAIIKSLSPIDESIAHLQPKDSMFRINRDVRFSKDKSPYKTNMGIYFSKGGKKGNTAGYYLHVEPGKSFIAAGLWMPLAPELKKVRQEIDYSWDEFRKIFLNNKFKSIFGELDRNAESVLSRPPKGYDNDNPAIEVLKLKSFIASTELSDEDLTSKNCVKKIVGHFQTLKPLVDFLNRAVED